MPTSLISRLGQSFIFLGQSLRSLPKVPSGFKRLSQQIYNIGLLSLPIMLVAGTFMGLVLCLQGYKVLIRFGGEQVLGQLVGFSLLREIGPVVSALLFAGRAGSALTAEIGLMKTTEQLASMSMLGVDPLRRIMSSRIIASVIALPILMLLFVSFALLASQSLAQFLGLNQGTFWASIQQNMQLRDVFMAILKSEIFVVLIAWVACFQGYVCEPTAEGVSYSTTKTVVNSSLLILGLDFLLTAIMF